MKLFKSVEEIRNELKSFSSIGLVPTMGSLHEGHLSLVNQAQAENDQVVVSIFLNPTQFNNKEDFEKYPTSLDADIDLLREKNVDLLFLPDFETIYPDNFKYQVSESELSHQLCGKNRPGHFDGVLTVVLKLFNIIKPTKAYFGEKDFQQLSLIKGMIDAFFLDVELISSPIVRDNHGLALSSRNKRLSDSGLNKARNFAQALAHTKDIELLDQNLKDQGIKIDYLQNWGNRRYAAVEIENVRLIDNVEL